MDKLSELTILGELHYNNKRIGYLINMVVIYIDKAIELNNSSKKTITTFVSEEALKCLKDRLKNEDKGIFNNNSKSIVNIKNCKVDNTYITFENVEYTRILLAYLRRKYKNCYASDTQVYLYNYVLEVIDEDISMQVLRKEKEHIYYDKFNKDCSMKPNELFYINILNDYTNSEEFERILVGDKSKKQVYFTSYRRERNKDYIVGIRRYIIELESKPKNIK